MRTPSTKPGWLAWKVIRRVASTTGGRTAPLFLGLALAGLALVRSSLVDPGWILTCGSLLMGLARFIDVRAVEVVALVLGALGWTAHLPGAGTPYKRWIRPVPHSEQNPPDRTGGAEGI